LPNIPMSMCKGIFKTVPKLSFCCFPKSWYSHNFPHSSSWQLHPSRCSY
jgi:hypothetical protein